MSNPRPLKLVSIKISGFQGVPPGKSLHLDNFGHRNVFIGENNAGKSLPIRFLHTFARAAKGQTKVLNQVVLGDFYPDSFWQQDEKSEITADLTFTAPSISMVDSKESAELVMVNDGKWNLRCVVRYSENQPHPVLWFLPLVQFRGKLTPCCRFDYASPGQAEFILANGEYGEAQSSNTYATFLSSYVTPLQQWISGCRFFDPVRGIYRSAKQPIEMVEDGSLLVTEMSAMAGNKVRRSELNNWLAMIRQKLSKLFRPAFASLEIVPTQPPEMYLTKVAGDSRALPLSHMGTGVQQMIIAYARLVKDDNTKEQKTYFIEEPETNLHPRLLRTFIRDLADYDSIQFFITTHSSVLLDSLGDGDKVYFFAQDRAGVCSATEAAEFVSQHTILDALGVTGGASLQTNCVIWVEGPSDRLYIRQWLNEYSNIRGQNLQEGVDYSFLLYGGSILSHFDFEPTDEQVQELISLLKISRFSAVIMDQNALLTQSQIRILEQAEKDNSHRFVRHTDLREIENDVQRDVFLFGVAEHLGKSRDALAQVQIRDDTRYTIQIARELTSDAAEQATIARKLSRKVELAMKVISICSREKMSLGCPSYIEPLFDFVIASRLDH